MKTTLLIFALLFIINCKSQKNNKIILPKIDNSKETFSHNLADNILIKLNSRNKKLSSDEQYRIRRNNKNNIGFSIYDSAKKREIVNFYNFGEFIMGYDYSENLIFGVYKEYYSSTMKLKTKGISCVYGFKVGKWYEYDEQGNLTRVEDTDIGYDFTHKDILKYCEKNNILFVRPDREHSGSISKIFFKEQYIWVINHYDYNSGFSMTIQISGKDGSVLGVFNNGKIPVN